MPSAPSNPAAIPSSVRPPAGAAEGRSLARAARPRSVYSRFVAVAKLALPLIALALVAIIWAWPQLRGTDLRFRLSFAKLITQDSADPNMINPRYAGTDDERQPYALTSDVARAPENDRARILLEQPKGDMTLKDGTWLLLGAETGTYVRSARTLDLSGDVTLFHDSGYEIRTTKAFVDLGRGEAEGREPVRGQGPFGDLWSEGFHLIDKGRVIYFTGKSKLIIHPGFRANPS
ncbi:MAG: hypothetical protein FJX42_03370 [Alphaproteobacteria bacterium]|nr:hypothetical protein [Alphaproteobacteria bacterium]